MLPAPARRGEGKRVNTGRQMQDVPVRFGVDLEATTPRFPPVFDQVLMWPHLILVLYTVATAVENLIGDDQGG